LRVFVLTPLTLLLWIFTEVRVYVSLIVYIETEVKFLAAKYEERKSNRMQQ